jgi:DNA-binding transcriptional ArsR family regulator
MLKYRDPLGEMFAALSDPTRRGIVDRLSRGPASVSELARPLAMSLPAVVQHVQVLEASGLVVTAKVGRVRTCRLEAANLAEVERWLRERRVFWQDRLDRLGRFLEEDEQAHPSPPKEDDDG